VGDDPQGSSLAGVKLFGEQRKARQTYAAPRALVWPRHDLVGQTNPKARQHKATDFFDNSFVKQLHDDGFVTQLYGG
ncbi:MAG TPA: hypothetical protein VMW62_17170, partial [Chloroflexota bacterium]|nr:hypothetical protein [Chloroflexota bacterium]